MTSRSPRLNLQEVRVRYLSGQTADTVAAALGASRSSIFRVLRATATPTRRIGRPDFPLDPGMVVDQYRKGRSLSEIARAFRCHRATILRMLKREGVYRPKSR